MGRTMHPTRLPSPSRPVRDGIALMAEYPRVYDDYTLSRFVTKLLKQARYWAQCQHCVYRTKISPDPGHPEHSMTQHLLEKHGLTRYPYGAH